MIEDPLAAQASPFQKFIALIRPDKRDIVFVYFYAIVVGIVNLSLPLGIQAIVSRISGGLIFESVYILIGFVIGGIILGGIMQVMQIWLVEVVQRRLLARVAFGFTYQLLRLRLGKVGNVHLPELMNRFFDTLTLQKGLPKALIDLSDSAMQVLFGLLLLSFYHPFFIAFSILLLMFLFILFRITGPLGLKTSIKESTYKYKLAFWLEEMARIIRPLRVASPEQALGKTNGLVGQYLYFRKAHFRILVSQYIWILVFRVLVTGGMLILGSALVVSRDITLGQFVASEIIIISLISAIDKIVLYMDVIYDLLTGAEKISQVTLLETEKAYGKTAPAQTTAGVRVEMQAVTVGAAAEGYDLRDISLEAGPGGIYLMQMSGQVIASELIDVLIGADEAFEGQVLVDGLPVKELELAAWRQQVQIFTGANDLVAGTLAENLNLVAPQAQMTDVFQIALQLGFKNDFLALSEGSNTQILPGGHNLPGQVAEVLPLICRLAARPRLLLIKDAILFITPAQKAQLIEGLALFADATTIIVFSADSTWLRVATNARPLQPDIA